VNSPIRRQIRLAHDELALECDLADEEKEERLASTIGTDDKPDAGATLPDPFHVPDERLNFSVSPDLDMLKP
jgi:hypothetical protein